MRLRTLALLGLGMTSACASRAKSGDAVVPAGTTASTAADARCVAVADSVRASTAVSNLPIAVPRGRPAFPRPRGASPAEIQATFLVNPAGRAVAGTVVITGATDPEFRRKMEDMVMRTAFRSPVVSGCPSWGRGEFQLRSEVRVETRTVRP